VRSGAEGEDVDAVPLDSATLGVRGGRRPFADHEVVADVAAATAEAQVGLIGEGRLEQLPDGRSLGRDCAVWFSNTMSAVCIDMIASTSCSFQAWS
jgi:predicted RNA-binding Zn ribbon-like protein